MMSKRSSTDSVDPPALQHKRSRGLMEVDSNENDKIEVDESLYSRQLYVMGHEAQKKMMNANVLIVGLSGLGVEIAKNIILAGVKSVTLLDPSPVTSFDCGANFYFQESDIGKPRAATCIGRLAELNQYVPISLASGDTPDVTGMRVCVVTCGYEGKALLDLNDKCRAADCSFIMTNSCGVFGQIFVDNGKEFVVSDTDGEQPHTAQVSTILVDQSDSKKLTCSVLEDQGRHGLETGDVVKFSRVKGMPFLNETTHEVTVTGPFHFTFTLAADVDKEVSATQGYISQIKQAKTMNFRTLSVAMEDPGEMMISDFAKFDRPQMLHTGFRALQSYRDQAGTYPAPGDSAAAAAVVAAAKAIDGNLDENALKIIGQLASGSSSILSPMCAMLGGIVGQEVLKSCSGKFTPINGFFYFDATETLPDNTPADVAPKNCRYDSQIAVFGAAAQERILKLNYFLVGAGAIGCEMLKNWAMMGVGCGEGGHIHITDMDRIEKSNLSRQFLFRSTDINKAKSTTGAAAAKAMNPGLTITAHEQRVGKETENIFGDNFYDTMDGVCTALDNVEARLYMDQRCLFYQLPMLESGTLGTKGNTQIVVPKITENYGATRDPPEKSIPVCTLKNFPNQIQHTLQWARDYFEGAFKQSAEDANQYISNSNFEESLNAQQNSKVETLRTVLKTLVTEKPNSFGDCVAWARLRFEELFNNTIKQLLHNFPPDQKTAAGTMFWSGTKRCPTPLVFDIGAICENAEMRNHFDFIVAAANMRAEMYGIQGSTDEGTIKNLLSSVAVPSFTPVDGVKIAANEAEAKEEKEKEGSASSGAGMDPEAEAKHILSQLPAPSSLGGFQLTPVEFDKDIDDHMLFVTACSNLRALNYEIDTEDTHKSRAIAGKIIPAIATTTAMVTGLICLELYKLVGTPQKELTIEAYKSAFCNLAIPFMTLSEPQPPAKTKTMVNGEEFVWSPWDSLDVNLGNVTLGEFITWYSDKYNVEISMVSYGVAMLYSSFGNKERMAKRMAMTMSDAVADVSKAQLPDNQLFLVLEVMGDDRDTDEEVDLPYCKFRFR